MVWISCLRAVCSHLLFSQERSGSTENRSEEDEGSDLCDVHSTTVKLLKLNKAIKDLHSSLSRYLRGKAFFPQ